METARARTIHPHTPATGERGAASVHASRPNAITGLGGSMEFLRRGRHSHLTLQINFTHLKKGHTTLNSKCSNDQTAPRPCEGASFLCVYGPGPTSKRKAQIDASAPLQAAPEPPNCRGGLEQRRTQQLATIPSTPDPARRRRKQALVSRRLAHWQRG